MDPSSRRPRVMKERDDSKERGRSRFEKPAVLLVIVLALGANACGGGNLPRPRMVPARAEDYVAVTQGPRTPPVEIVPAKPKDGAVWVDGGWAHDGTRFRWEDGAWVIPPDGATYS